MHSLVFFVNGTPYFWVKGMSVVELSKDVSLAKRLGPGDCFSPTFYKIIEASINMGFYKIVEGNGSKKEERIKDLGWVVIEV